MKYLNHESEELIKKHAIHTAKEISQQPEIWNQLGLELVQRKADIRAFLDKVMSKPDLRIILTGAGSSAFAGEMIMPYLNSKLRTVVESIATTDLVATPGYYFLKEIPTLLISFGRSGDSPESVAASKLGEQVVDDFYEVIVTCNAEGELALSCKDHPKKLLLLMPDGSNDKGFAMTSSFTSMALGTLGLFECDKLEAFSKDLKLLSDSVRQFMSENSLHIQKAASISFDRYICLGSGMLRGASREASLKMLELTKGKVGTGYDSPLAFRHGPKSIVNDNTLIVYFLSSDNYAAAYDRDLINELHSQKKGNKLILVGAGIPADLKSKCDLSFELALPEFTFSKEVFLPFACITFAQIFALSKSLEFGITPDNPCPSGEVNRVVKGVTIHPYK